MQNKINELLEKTNRIILGKEEKVKLCTLSLLCGGHVLIEDIPGVGKTTLVKVLSKLLGLKFSRIQFTSDLLPGDILGTHIFKKKEETFSFKKGPIFSQIILADELNRTTPKTQSALLEVMEEKKVSQNGEVFDLEFPFLVMATQNPFGQVGTFPLPESQRDRFLMGVHLGPPDRENEKRILQQGDTFLKIKDLEPILDTEMIKRIRASIQGVGIKDDLLNYVLDVLQFFRNEGEMKSLLSPRCGKDLVLAAKGNAFFEGRGYVLPEDVQFVAPGVLAHRLFTIQNISGAYLQIQEMLKSVNVP